MTTPGARAADPQAAASTINHAFATELGTGAYDLGGNGGFVVRFTPAWDLKTPGDGLPGVRLILPLTAGSIGFDPVGSFEQGRLPSRIDSFSLMPGLEFDFAAPRDWTVTPWVRAGASFAEGNDGWLYGAGVRMSRDSEEGEVAVNRRHELALVVVDYRSAQATDRFLRLRNAFDLRRPTIAFGADSRLLAGLYGIADIVPDPPEAPADAGKQSVLQLEVGFTFNAAPRPKLWLLRWPRLGIGYRYAGDFSGWRIVVGAPY
jgi:hypothetical protein